MSKLIDYKCNLCGERKTVEQVVGLHWTGSGVEPRNPPATENHLCEHCLTALSTGLTRLIEFQVNRK
jgi:hypothetical protein